MLNEIMFDPGLFALLEDRFPVDDPASYLRHFRKRVAKTLSPGSVNLRNLGQIFS